VPVRRVPLGPLAIAGATGIALAPLSPGRAPLWAAYGTVLAVALVGLVTGRPRVAAVALLLAVTALGALRASPLPLPPDHLATLPLPAAVRVEGRLTADPVRVAPDRIRVRLDADTLIVGDTAPRVTGRVQLGLYGEAPPLAEGQRVRADLRIDRPRSFRNPGGFDYEAHLARQGILVVGSGRAERLTPLSPAVPPWNAAVRRWASDVIRGALPPVSAALLAGLLLGERTGLPRELDEAFQRAGVYHVLAVSGFNVALLAGSVFATLALAGVPRGARAAVAIPVVGAFALVVGAEASVLRAALMASLLLAGLLLDREPNLLNSLALAAIVILAAQPGDLRDPGFQLSFAATLGIVAGAGRVGPQGGRRWRRWLVGAIEVSAAAQLAVTPITLHHFNQCSLVGIIANLAVVPLAGLATLAGTVALLAAALSSAAGRVLVDSLWPVLLALRAVVYLIARIPFATVHLPAPHWTAIVAYYLGLTALVAAIPRPIPGDAGPREPAPGRRLGIAGAGLVTLALALGAWPIIRPANERLRLAFLDVGQGDAIVIEFPDGRTALVDAGPGGPLRLDAGERVVAPYLWNRGVRRLALAAITHEDLDHAGGMGSLRRLFAADEVWSGDRVSGGTPRFVAGVGVSVLNPPPARAVAPGRGRRAERNDESLVLRLDYGLASFLLTADIEGGAEGRLVGAGAPLRARVLKVAHHGARSSSGEDFLRAVGPELAVISVGARNPFGHPSLETLGRLRQAGARIYRTDEDGAVLVETDGRELVVTTWASGKTDRYRLDSTRASPPAREGPDARPRLRPQTFGGRPEQ
jgi:competence protein ComEC